MKTLDIHGRKRTNNVITVTLGATMKRTLGYVVALSSFGFLIGCTEPRLAVMNRSTGEVGTGSVQNSTLGASGPMSFSFANEVYNGTWVAVADSGSVSFGLLSAYSSSGNSAFGNASAYSMATGGFGTAIMTSSKGNSARCEVRYDSWAMTAAGICQRQDGVIFDLQMTSS
jgi:hypothetical protein